ncbi:hypothetical protein BYT27DRAFT_7220244 [Phlegmacium glaucopus]|nr:hypothetical protein BYT27DRAFT_7220244 [Phlegmacium glaucopus]
MFYDESEDLVYNPFAEDLSESNLTHGFSSSSVHKLSDPQLALSLSEQNSVKRTAGERRKHSRSVPEISIVPHSDGLHPLKSALATQNDTVLYDLGVTRPHLSRIVNERTSINVKSSEPEDTLTIKTPLGSDEETEVIVHQVTSKDSLAGVSLKYGISLANLRRANQLWATDSIHLRDLLYIPIEQAFRAREFIPEPQLTSLTSESWEPGASIHAPPIHISPFTEESVESSSTNPLIPIRRMPSSQLTFFPPSSNKNLESSINGHFEDAGTHLYPSGNHKSPAGSNSRYISSSASNSLSSILTALPIAASTRDEIITRLSFDSVSSSFSDRSRTNSDEDIGHELDDVPKHKSSRIARTVCEDVDDMSLPTPKASRHPLHSEILSNQHHSRITSSLSLPKNSYVHSLSSTSPPRFYVSQAYEASVRTYQMEPSPEMHLPTFRNQTVGHSSGKRAQGKATDNTTPFR